MNAMTLWNKVENMTNDELIAIWNSFKNMIWDGSTMYDKNTTMDEWGMMIAEEMDSRSISKFN